MKEKSTRQQLRIYLAKENVALQEASAIGTHFSPENVRWNIEPENWRQDVPQVTGGCDEALLAGDWARSEGTLFG
jgi:hypothetical protein